MILIASFIRVESGKVQEILENLKKVPQIRKIFTITGEYNFLIESEVEQPEKFVTVIDKIEEFPGLIDIHSHLILKEWTK